MSINAKDRKAADEGKLRLRLRCYPLTYGISQKFGARCKQAERRYPLSRTKTQSFALRQPAEVRFSEVTPAELA
ncbi:MAG: hypothetical protein ABSE93_17710 [Terriglobia bacterium]|jgi:hypothetical protein